ncbi:MAG: glycosyltransferase family 9 protein, partial [Planctomycetota bacterium]
MAMRILLRNHMALGDTVLMTCGVRDLKASYPDYQIRVETNYPEIWQNNPNLSDFEGYDEVYNVGPKIVVQSSKTNHRHFTEAWRVCLEDRLAKPIKQGPFRPELFLADAEKENPLIDGPYWLIDIDCGPYQAKRWLEDRWQQVIDRLDWITFVQTGLLSRNNYRLRGDNVIDFVGRTENKDNALRDIFNLHYHAQGSIGLVSAQMHISAAFEKPCVVVAGGREPVTLEAYSWHRYIHNIGSLPCSMPNGCWRCQLETCAKQSGGLIDGRSKCMAMIKVNDVVGAIESYYEGGVLKRPRRLAINKTKPVLRIVCNAKMLGGAERSVIEIIKAAGDYDVELAVRGTICNEFKKCLPPVTITNKISAPCDVLLVYASDMVWDFHKPEFDVFNKLSAKKKVMALTYKIGKAGIEQWTKGWDLYLFLCTTLETRFLEQCPDAPTKVLAPPVDIEPFLRNRPPYRSRPNTIARHSSQGDNKYSKSLVDIVAACRDTKFSFMPPPSFMPDGPNIIKH